MHISRFIWPSRLGGKLAVLTCAFVIVLVGVYQFAVWSLSRQLAALIESDRRMGLPTTLAEAYGPVIPEHENAEGPLLAGAEIAEALHRQVMREMFGSDELYPAQYSRRDPKYIARMGRLADANATFTGSIAEAERRPRLAFTTRPQDAREHARQYASAFDFVLQAEAARAFREMDDGDRDAALDRLTRLYRLGRLGYEASPSFEWWNIVNNVIRDKVHWAIDRVLNSGPCSDRTRDALDEALALAEENLRSAARAHQGQRLFAMDNYQLFGGGPGAVPAWTWFRPIDLRIRVEIAETAAKFAPDESASGKSALANRRPHIKERAESYKSTLYRALLAPALTATDDLTHSAVTPYREIAIARCLRVLNALQRCNGMTTDAETLGLPLTASIDPFTEEPLRIIKTKTGWVVYSLGENQKELAPEDISTETYVVGKVDELPKRKK
jgi:hypothetical protein